MVFLKHFPKKRYLADPVYKISVLKPTMNNTAYNDRIELQKKLQIRNNRWFNFKPLDGSYTCTSYISVIYPYMPCISNKFNLNTILYMYNQTCMHRRIYSRWIIIFASLPHLFFVPFFAEPLRTITAFRLKPNNIFCVENKIYHAEYLWVWRGYELKSDNTWKHVVSMYVWYYPAIYYIFNWLHSFPTFRNNWP